MLKFAQYNTTSSHAPPTEAHALVFGIMKNNPNSTSNSPLTKTQNRASPSTEGTIGSYQIGSTKWCTPIEMEANPIPAAPKLRITLCLLTQLRNLHIRKRNVTYLEQILALKTKKAPHRSELL